MPQNWLTEGANREITGFFRSITSVLNLLVILGDEQAGVPRAFRCRMAHSELSLLLSRCERYA
jgi:hypothetical protein